MLDMILGGMLEELSSVKPMTRLGLDNGSRLLVTPQNSLIQPFNAAKKLLRLSIATRSPLLIDVTIQHSLFCSLLVPPGR